MQTHPKTSAHILFNYVEYVFQCVYTYACTGYTICLKYTMLVNIEDVNM